MCVCERERERDLVPMAQIVAQPTGSFAAPVHGRLQPLAACLDRPQLAILHTHILKLCHPDPEVELGAARRSAPAGRGLVASLRTAVSEGRDTEQRLMCRCREPPELSHARVIFHFAPHMCANPLAVDVVSAGRAQASS